jgi:NAD(P)H-dependent flavin oxidoreductase YrpB (nitropropane dioxygenase family)
MAVGMDSQGTRWMATQEAPIKQGIKQAIVDADVNSTTLIMRSVRNTERVYKNAAALEVQAIEAAHPGDFEKFGCVVKR